MKATEPMMPFEIWQERSILIANLVSLTTGVMMIGLSSFLPTFVQGVMERSPTVAGFTLTAMSIGWPIASMVSGKLLMKIVSKRPPPWRVLADPWEFDPSMDEARSRAPYCCHGILLCRCRDGFDLYLIHCRHSKTVSWERRGIATASNMFMRNLGNTVGAALLGGIMNTRLQAYLNEHAPSGSGVTIDTANKLLNSEERTKLPENVVKVLQEGLTLSLQTIYLIVLVFSVISFMLLTRLRKNKKAYENKADS